METTTEAWKRLGRYIKRRREHLRLTQQEMYAKGGPSVATIRILEAGEQAGYRNRTYHQVEESLGWAEGSIEAILAGKEPTPRNGRSHLDSVEIDSASPSTDVTPAPSRRQETLEELQAQLNAVLAKMSPEARERWMAEMAREEVERLERWRRLLTGEPSNPD